MPRLFPVRQKRCLFLYTKGGRNPHRLAMHDPVESPRLPGACGGSSAAVASNGKRQLHLAASTHWCLAPTKQSVLATAGLATQQQERSVFASSSRVNLCSLGTGCLPFSVGVERERLDDVGRTGLGWTSGGSWCSWQLQPGQTLAVQVPHHNSCTLFRPSGESIHLYPPPHNTALCRRGPAYSHGLWRCGSPMLPPHGGQGPQKKGRKEKKKGMLSTYPCTVLCCGVLKLGMLCCAVQGTSSLNRPC